MKKLLIFGFLVMLAVASYSQDNHPWGIYIGRKILSPDPTLAKITKATFTGHDVEFWNGATQWNPAVPPGDQVLGIALADSTGYVQGNYMTRENVLVETQTNFAQHIYALIGSTIKAEPLFGNMMNIATLFTLLDQQAQYSLVYLPRSEIITGVKWWQATQGNYTADNYNGVALFSLSGGVITLIDSCTRDGNIWKATQSMASKAFPATHVLSAGVYIIELIYSQSAEVTAPVIGGVTFGSTALSSGDFTNSVKLSSKLINQTSIVSPKNMSALSNQTPYIYVALY